MGFFDDVKNSLTEKSQDPQQEGERYDRNISSE